MNFYLHPSRLKMAVNSNRRQSICPGFMEVFRSSFLTNDMPETDIIMTYAA